MIELCDKIDCTGCGACYAACPKQAITMKPDAEGFLFPEIDSELCVSCTLCQKVCPILTPVPKNEKVEGPLAAVAKSETLRKSSSSGGMFSLLAQQIIAEGGVVFGAVMNEQKLVLHQKAESVDELAAMRGSKYMQSNTQLTYREVKQFLKQGRKVLYTGTPCQIAGLYGYLGKADRSLLYTADLVCHGTPSSYAFQLYLRKLAEKEGCQDIKRFVFRDLPGWDCSSSYYYYYKGGELKAVRNQPVHENLYMRLFLGSFLHREGCYHCRYTTQERVSDLTLADFWGVGAEKPFAYDTSKGCSLVLLNTDKGRVLFDSVSSLLDYEQREWAEALVQNHQLRVVSSRPKGREKVYAYMVSHTYDETMNHYFNTPYLRVRRMVGNFLRTLHLRK